MFVDILGSTAGAFTAFSFLPQVIKVAKTRSVNDISTLMYVIYCLGLVMWVIYGVYLNSMPIIIANTATAILAFGILIMKVVFSRNL